MFFPVLASCMNLHMLGYILIQMLKEVKSEKSWEQ